MFRRLKYFDAIHANIRVFISLMDNLHFCSTQFSISCSCELLNHYILKPVVEYLCTLTLLLNLHQILTSALLWSGLYAFAITSFQWLGQHTFGLHFSYTQILLTSRIRCCQTQYNIGTLNKYVFPLEGNTTSEVITCSECNMTMSYISVLYLYIDWYGFVLKCTRRSDCVAFVDDCRECG